MGGRSFTKISFFSLHIFTKNCLRHLGVDTCRKEGKKSNVESHAQGHRREGRSVVEKSFKLQKMKIH